MPQHLPPPLKGRQPLHRNREAARCAASLRSPSPKGEAFSRIANRLLDPALRAPFGFDCARTPQRGVRAPLRMTHSGVRKKPPSGRGEGDLRNTIFARGEPAGVTRAERITPNAQPNPFVRILLPSFCRPKRPYAINLQNATSLPEGGFFRVSQIVY